MKKLYIISLAFTIFTAVSAQVAIPENPRKVVVVYDIDFEFINILYERWLGINAPDSEIPPRVSPRGIITAGGIVIDNDDVFQHNIVAGHHIIMFKAGSAKHKKFVDVYKNLMKVPPKTVSNVEHKRLLLEEEKLRGKQNESDGGDPFE